VLKTAVALAACASACPQAAIGHNAEIERHEAADAFSAADAVPRAPLLAGSGSDSPPAPRRPGLASQARP